MWECQCCEFQVYHNSSLPQHEPNVLHKQSVNRGSLLTSSSLGSCLAMLFSKEMVGFLAVSRMSSTFLSPRSSRPLARMPTLITPFSSRAEFSVLSRAEILWTVQPAKGLTWWIKKWRWSHDEHFIFYTWPYIFSSMHVCTQLLNSLGWPVILMFPLTMAAVTLTLKMV